jgi:uncharacterized membrane protein
LNWSHTLPSILAAFLASLVECVEALTVVLAVGSVRGPRGWRSALAGVAVALAVLLAIVSVLGRALTRIPLHLLQGVVGALLLLFGLRWLRKAILRAAGFIPLHDETAAFAKNARAMQGAQPAQGWDKVAFGASFQITMLEGTEVVFIVIAIGAGGPGLFLPASLGALAALVVVTALGFVVHRPLARVPENTLKFIVGGLLSAFGTFWVGEGIGLAWPGADWAIAALVAGYLLVALAAIQMCRAAAQPRTVESK